MSYFGLTFGEYPGDYWGRALVPPPPPPVIEVRGGYAPPKKRKQRDFEQERRDREALRRFIEKVLEPIEESAEVVATTDAVAVLPTRGKQITLPVPPAFSAAEVTETVMAVLRENAVQAERVRTAEARKRAAAEVAQALERIRIRRRREEEWLLLMD